MPLGTVASAGTLAGLGWRGMQWVFSTFLLCNIYFFLLITLTVCPHPAKGGRVAHTETDFFPWNFESWMQYNKDWKNKQNLLMSIHCSDRIMRLSWLLTLLKASFPPCLLELPTILLIYLFLHDSQSWFCCLQWKNPDWHKHHTKK